MVLRFVDGPNHNLEGEEVAISTLFMESKVIGDLFIFVLCMFYSPFCDLCSPVWVLN